MGTTGFIGLGRMGCSMASNLVRKGFDLVVHDIVADRVDTLARLGAVPASSPAQQVAARAEVVMTMLPGPASVRDVITGRHGVLATARQGTIVVDMSTVDPGTTDAMAELCRDRGLEFIDAPVGRLASHADAGESLFMVGGTSDSLERVRPLLEAMGTALFHCGPCGTGTRTKLVNNFMSTASCQINAEALVLAASFGLDLDRTLDVICGTSAVNGQISSAWPVKVLADDTSPGFTIDLAHKDLSLVVEAANAAGVPMPMAATARETYSVAKVRGYGGKDFSAMLDAHCDVTGTPRPRLVANSTYRTAKAIP